MPLIISNSLRKSAWILSQIKQYCEHSSQGRGIWKRIDENRELLQFLQKQTPEFLERWPFIEGWIAGEDVFLVNIREMLELPENPPFSGSTYPRPWPGKEDITSWYHHYFTPANLSISAAPEDKRRF